jgi:hypothetical protein
MHIRQMTLLVRWPNPERFEHPDLKDWTRDNRARILSALLTIGRRWFAQGKPVPDDAPSLGSFESWSRTLAGVLHAAGVAGFLANSGQLYERASEDPGSWEAFLDAWRTGYGAERVAARKIAEDLYEEDYAALRQALPDEFGLLDENIRDKNLAKRLGRAFAKREGVPYGPRKLHLARAGTESRAVLWTVRQGSDLKQGMVNLTSSVSFSQSPPRVRAGVVARPEDS